MNLPESFQKFSSLITADAPLSTCTYMKVGGKADYVAAITQTDDLVELVQAAQQAQLPYFILGGGSNTIFTDAGFRGLVILNRTNRVEIDSTAGRVIAASGVPTNQLVNETVNAGWGGLEEFLGTPGTIGGAVYNNSHYLHHLISEVISQVELFDHDGRRHWVQPQELDFAYDYSNLQKSHELILTVEFKLQPRPPQELRLLAQQALKRRRETQPLELPSSGCIFKNFAAEAPHFPKLPSGVTSAGALIDSLGLKGHQVGGAAISQLHANFIVNTGQATAKDIIDLSNQVINLVKEKYDLTLKREVFIVDEHGERIYT